MYQSWTHLHGLYSRMSVQGTGHPAPSLYVSVWYKRKGSCCCPPRNKWQSGTRVISQELDDSHVLGQVRLFLPSAGHVVFVGERELACEVTPGFPQVPAEPPRAGLSAPEPHFLNPYPGVRTSLGMLYRFWVILGWPKSLFCFLHKMALVVLSCLLTSFETILLDCIVIAVISMCIKKHQNW